MSDDKTPKSDRYIVVYLQDSIKEAYLMKFTNSSRSEKKASEEWAALIDLLEGRDYENAKSTIREAQKRASENGESARISLFTAAFQICSTCQDYFEAITTYKCAYEDAVAREHDLRQQLISLLIIISETQSKNSCKPGDLILEESMSKATKTNKNFHIADKALELWQKLQVILQAEENTSKDDISFRIESANKKITLQVADEQKQKIESESPEKNLLESNNQPHYFEDVPTLSVYCLGSFRAYVEDVLIDEWSGNIGKTIFKYLLSHRELPVHRDVLIDMFWPDDPVDSARRNLYQAIYSIRQAFRKSGHDLECILLEDSAYMINPALKLWVDADAFLDHYKKGSELEQQGNQTSAIRHYELAENLYGGDYLCEDIFEQWALIQRENFKMIYLEILSRISQYYWDLKAYKNCIINCRKILDADDCREDAHRRLMLAYLELGQRHLAIRQFHQCATTLKQELNITPMPATVELYQMLKKVDVQK